MAKESKKINELNALIAKLKAELAKKQKELELVRSESMQLITGFASSDAKKNVVPPSGSPQSGQLVDILALYLAQARPPEHLRPELDLDYVFEGQSVVLQEIRPRFNNPDEKFTSGVAKATWNKAKQIWKIYWRRANGKWDLYEPQPELEDFRDFLELVEEDEFGCFWG